MSIQEGESLGSWGPRPVYTESMRSNGQTGRADGHALGGGKDLECRRCRVLCERVVHPVECVRHGCSYTYAFTQEDITFFGCLEKVFAPELNLQPHIESPRRDPYGALRCRGILATSASFLRPRHMGFYTRGGNAGITRSGRSLRNTARKWCVPLWRVPETFRSNLGS